MGRMSYRWTTAICIVVLAACSNGRGTLQEPPPPASPGQVEPPPTTPTDPPTPPTPPPPIEPPPPPPTPPPPTAAAAAGYWFGTADGPGGRTYGARALITASGDLHFIVSSTVDYASTPQLLVYGNVCCEATMDADLKSKRYLSARETDSRFRGSVQGTKLIGDAKIRGDEYKFSLDLSVRYSETLTLADLAGTYTRTTTPFIGPSSTLTFTIDPSGQLNGTHTSGCVYAGTVTIADPPRNLARLSVQVSNCPTSITGSGSLNGQYSGLGFLARDTPAPYSTTRTNVFMHSLIGPTWLGQQPMEK